MEEEEEVHPETLPHHAETRMVVEEEEEVVPAEVPVDIPVPRQETHTEEVLILEDMEVEVVEEIMIADVILTHLVAAMMIQPRHHEDVLTMQHRHLEDVTMTHPRRDHTVVTVAAVAMVIVMVVVAAPVTPMKVVHQEAPLLHALVVVVACLTVPEDHPEDPHVMTDPPLCPRVPADPQEDLPVMTGPHGMSAHYGEAHHHRHRMTALHPSARAVDSATVVPSCHVGTKQAPN